MMSSGRVSPRDNRRAGPRVPARDLPRKNSGLFARLPARAAFGLDERLARAQILGHRMPELDPAVSRSADAGSLSPGVDSSDRSVAIPRRDASSDAIQRAIGFELELQVLLTSGPPLDGPKNEGEFPLGLGDLQAGTIAPRPQVGATKHTVVLADGSQYAWNEESDKDANVKTVIQPDNIEETDRGRWLFVGEAQGDSAYSDPLLKKEEKVYEQADLIAAVEDHAPETLDPSNRLQSIVELVAAPRDELMEDEVFLEPMRAAIDFTGAIESATNGFEKRVPAMKIFPGARADLYLGYDMEQAPNSMLGPPKQKQSAAAAMQASYAVQLASLPSWMESLVSPSAPKRALAAEAPLIGDAIHAAIGTMSMLVEEGLITQPDPAFLGLLHVLCLYLAGGHETRSGSFGDNIKNYVPLLNRAGIDTYANQESFFGEEASGILSDGTNRGKLIGFLVKSSGRDFGQPVLQVDEDAPKVGDWLEQVLSGSGDALRAYSRFGRSKVIPHENVGPEQNVPAPVFEERQVPTPEEMIKLRPDLVDVSQWEDVAMDYKKRLMAANAPLEEEELAVAESPSDVLPNLGSMVGARTRSILSASGKLGKALGFEEEEMKVDMPVKVEVPNLVAGDVIQYIPSGEEEAIWGKVLKAAGNGRFVVATARTASKWEKSQFDDGAKIFDPEKDTFQMKFD